MANFARTLLLTLALLLPLAAAQAQPASLSGVVTQSAGGAPASGVTVEAFVASTFASAGSVVVGPTSAWMLSVPAGSYRVRAAGPGYIDEFFDNVVCEFGSCNFFGATIITLAPAAVRNDVNFALDATGSLSGTVRRESDNAPLAGVQIMGTPSAIDGSYTIELPPGAYVLLSSNQLGFIDEYHDNLSCPGGGCDPTGATVFDVVGGGSTSGIDFALARGGTLSGHVLGTNAQPILDTGIDVQVIDAIGTILATATPDAAGAWSVTTGLLPGSYRAVARPQALYAPRVFNDRSCPQDDGNLCDVAGGDPIAISAGNDAPGIDFVLPRVAASIAGRVTRLADSSGFEGVDVTATRSDGQFFGILTDASGDYRIDGVVAGSYHVVITPPSGSSELAENWPEQQCLGPGQCTGPGTAVVLAAGEDRGGIDAQLAPFGTANITLRNADTAMPMRGSLSVLLPTSNLPDTVPVNSPASIAVPVLNGGPVRFAGIASECGASGDRICLGLRFPNAPCPNLHCEIAAGASLLVPKGETASAELVLVAGAHIAGRIIEDAGPSIDGLPLEIVTAADELIIDGMTSTNGEFSLGGLGVGPYFVRTRAPTSFINEIFDNVPCPNGNCSPATGSALTLTLGQTLGGVDFSLARGGGLSGTVRSAFTTQPIAGATVAFYAASGARVAQVSSAADGGWLSPVLANGTYTLTINAAGFAAELYDNLPCLDLACDPTTGAAVLVSAPTTVTGLDADLEPLASLVPTLLYLNRCTGGCTVTPGIDDSRSNRSSLVSGTTNIAAFAFADPAFAQVAECVRTSLAPYLVGITTVDPGNVPHFEVMIGGSPGSLGLPNTVAGVAPWAGGSLIQNAIAFVFSATIGNNPTVLCDVSAHEAGHLLGLDHHLIATDHMSYLESSQRAFVDASASCGEYTPRACDFGAPTQNTHQRLFVNVGDKTLLFRDGFEAPPPARLPLLGEARQAKRGWFCGFDGARLSLPPAIYFRPSGPTIDASRVRSGAH